jgi:hypothetical protein
MIKKILRSIRRIMPAIRPHGCAVPVFASQLEFQLEGPLDK